MLETLLRRHWRLALALVERARALPAGCAWAVSAAIPKLRGEPWPHALRILACARGSVKSSR